MLFVITIKQNAFIIIFLSFYCAFLLTNCFFYSILYIHYYEGDMKMANEKKESTAIAEYKDFEISDFVDAAVAQGTFDAYVYSYKQGNREVTGLSARAIEHLALEREIDTDPVNLKVEEKDDGVLTTVTAILEIVRPATREERPDGTIIETEGYTKKIRRAGINHSPFVSYGKPDPFVYQKAMTKAMRNAMSRLNTSYRSTGSERNFACTTRWQTY